MNIRFLTAIIFLILSTTSFAQDAEETTELDPAYKDDPIYEEDEKPPEFSEPTVEDEGLEFLMYNENEIMAFAIIADHERYNLRPVLARNQIQGRSTLAQISKGLNEIALINSSYFMPSGSLVGITKIDNEIIGVDEYNRSAIGINYDGTTIFGRVNYQGEIIFNGATQYISGVNCERGADTTIIYNRYFGETTGTNEYGIEIVVKNNIITEIFNGTGNNFIPLDSYIISVHGTARDIFNGAGIGDELIIEQTIFSQDYDFNEVPYVIGAGPRLIKNGRISITDTAEQFPKDIRVGKAPRSAVGVTEYGDYILAVADGRQSHSKGCTLQEWADILLKFGAVNAINLDGGGSTELIVKDSLVNRPSDGRERLIADALAILPK